MQRGILQESGRVVQPPKNAMMVILNEEIMFSLFGLTNSTLFLEASINQKAAEGTPQHGSH